MLLRPPISASESTTPVATTSDRVSFFTLDRVNGLLLLFASVKTTMNSDVPFSRTYLGALLTWSAVSYVRDKPSLHGHQLGRCLPDFPGFWHSFVVQILIRKSEKWAALLALRKRGRWLLLLLQLRSTGSEKDYDCVYLYPYKNVSLTFEPSIAKTVPKDHENVSSRERVVNLIVTDHAYLPSSQFPAHQVSTFECPKLLGSFRYLATSVMGWNKFSQ